MGVSGPGSEASRPSRKKEKVPEGPSVRWVIGPHVRADVVGYSGLNVTGTEMLAQLYPSGHRTGTIDGEKLQSLAIGAPLGTRVILCASEDDQAWEKAPWRCIRIVEGSSYETKDGTPAVRIPDLDWLDAYDQRRAKLDTQESYPFTMALGGGNGWTFGRGGGLKNQVRMIRVEHETRPIQGA